MLNLRRSNCFKGFLAPFPDTTSCLVFYSYFRPLERVVVSSFEPAKESDWILTVRRRERRSSLFLQSRTVSTSVKDTVSFYTFCLALYVDEQHSIALVKIHSRSVFRSQFSIISPFSYKLETQFIYICTLRGHPYASIRIVFILIAFFTPELEQLQLNLQLSSQRAHKGLYIISPAQEHTHRVSPLYYCIQLLVLNSLHRFSTLFRVLQTSEMSDILKIFFDKVKLRKPPKNHWKESREIQFNM